MSSVEGELKVASTTLLSAQCDDFILKHKRVVFVTTR
jgi:hypothetical protein